MSSVFVPALHFSIVQLSDIMNTCFQQYVVPLSVTPDYFATRFGAEGLNFQHSGVWMQGETPVAIVLIATRGREARIAAFALNPDFRGQGRAKQMMTAVLSRLAAEHIGPIWLEVIGGNTAAIALYETLGFRITQTLLGFSGPGPSPGSAPPLEHTPTDVLLHAIWRAPQEETPWLLDPLAFPALPCEVVGNGEPAWGVIDRLTGTPQLRYLFVDPACRRQGLGSDLLASIGAHYPGIRTPVAVPQRLAPLFHKAGFEPMALTQYEMCLSR